MEMVGSPKLFSQLEAGEETVRSLRFDHKAGKLKDQGLQRGGELPMG